MMFKVKIVYTRIFQTTTKPEFMPGSNLGKSWEIKNTKSQWWSHNYFMFEEKCYSGRTDIQGFGKRVKGVDN